MTGLEDLYREIVLDHYRNPRNKGEINTPTAVRVEGFNPLCGDEIVVTLDLNPDGTLNIKIDGRGCSISQSSASLMSETIKGSQIKEARNKVTTFKNMMTIHENSLESSDDNETSFDIESLGELAALQGVVKFPVRIKCATLAWNTLLEGLDDLEKD